MVNKKIILIMMVFLLSAFCMSCSEKPVHRSTLNKKCASGYVWVAGHHNSYGKWIAGHCARK